MRREFVIGVTLLAAFCAACSGLGSERPSISATESAGVQAQTPSPTSSERSRPSLTPIPPDSAAELSAPPSARLVIEGEEQISGQGSYCWRDERGAPLCADRIGIPTAQEPLAAQSPFTARFNLFISQPVTESQLRVFPVTPDEQFDSEALGWRWWRPKFDAREEFTLTPGDAISIELSLEPGLYVLSLFVRVQGVGDAGYGFLVEVR